MTLSEVESWQQNLPLNLDDVWANPSQHVAAVFDEGDIERDKTRLIGVPFVITRVVYHSDLKFPKGYVTAYGNIAPTEFLQEAIQRGWIPDVNSVSELLFRPGEVIKFNDGSTGVRRQLTQVLHNLGAIDIGAVQSKDDFDRPWDEWESFSQASQENGEKDKKTGEVEKIDIPDITINPQTGGALVIMCRHGLRASFMEEFEKNVFYLA
jgi:hypothetical protein